MANLTSSKTMAAQDLQNIRVTVDTWDDGTTTVRTSDGGAPANVATATATIANGGTVSDAVALAGRTLTGLILPATFTGTALTFQVSADNVTYTALYDSTNAAESMTVTQGRAYSLNPSVFAGWAYMKIVSGTAEGGSRAITVVLRPVS